jgi:hypothetical protein
MRTEVPNNQAMAMLVATPTKALAMLMIVNRLIERSCDILFKLIPLF